MFVLSDGLDLKKVGQRARNPTVTRVGIVPPCRLTPRVGSRHGGTFPTRGDAILRNVKPVIPGVLVARGNWFNLSYDSITSVS